MIFGFDEKVNPFKYLNDDFVDFVVVHQLRLHVEILASKQNGSYEYDPELLQSLIRALEYFSPKKEHDEFLERIGMSSR